MKLFTILMLATSSLILGGCTRTNENPEQSIGGPFGEAVAVSTDNQGNFMAIWKSGVSVWARDYSQGVAQPGFRLGEGEYPRLAMSTTGDAYVSYHGDGVNSRYFSTYVHRYDRSTESWQTKIPISFSPYSHTLNTEISIYDDILVMSGIHWSGQPWVRNDRSGSANAQYLHTGYIKPGTTYYPLSNAPDILIVDGIDIDGVNVTAHNIEIASNHSGILAWSQQSPDGVYVSSTFNYYNSQYPAPWSNPQQVGTVVAQNGVLKSSIQADGSAIVAWKEAHPSASNAASLKLAVYDLKTDSWYTVVAPGSVASLEDNGLIDVSMDGQGHAMVFLKRALTGLVHYTYDMQSRTWSPMQTLYPDGNYTSIAVDFSPNGKGIVVWSVDNDVLQSIYDPSSKTWSSPVKIGIGNAPAAAIDDGGNCLIAWESDGFIYDYQCSDKVLNVSIAGDTGGKIISDPAGIDCGILNTQRTDFCSSGFNANSQVTLNAMADNGFVFSGWSGDCISSSSTGYILSMDADKKCTATFIPTVNGPANYQLDVGLSNATASRIVGTYLGVTVIDCGAICSAQLPQNADVTLSIEINGGETFYGWSGSCNPSTPTLDTSLQITVTMDQVQGCTAVFATGGGTGTATDYGLSVTVTGSGGIVRSYKSEVNMTGGPDIDCRETSGVCSVTYTVTGTTLPARLVATPDPGFTFGGWGAGQCDSEYVVLGSYTCELSLTAGSPTTRHVDATFN